MFKILYSDQLKIESATLPIHLASDRRAWVRLDEISEFVGVDHAQNVERANLELVRRDLLVLMDPCPDEEPCSGEEEVEYIDLAALPFWLGLICGETVTHPSHFEGLLSYSLNFLDITWMLNRAAAKLVGVAYEGQTHRTPQAD